MGVAESHGSSTAFDINIIMPKYLMPLARCHETGQTVKSVDLAHRFTTAEHAPAQLIANLLAENMQKRTGDTWTGSVDTYTIDSQKRTRL